MHRFFIQQENIGGDEIVLDGDNAAHVAVLRLRIGEEIVAAVSGGGQDYHAVVDSLSKNKVTAKITGIMKNISEMPIDITLFQALPKGNKMGEIIEHVVELGINNIVPIATARCVTGAEGKTARWQKIAESAAKLSHRGRIPHINGILTLKEALASAKSFDAVFACYELEKTKYLAQYLQNLDMSKIKAMAFFIGPEGGFASEEIALFEQSSIPALSLGNRILRTQSAAAMVMASINFHLQTKEANV
ncbi:MAG: 16S rRNA (uracil(1498)-N(3))-methyltransferase [Defluviitaleaceae bacterium]|nr:16S rRNA (uracil(1498)-N(3))-methyltransferase [Defluviitaleaceae bacterium]